MNNTLTGLGLALVLALLAALIGPWFINWSAYRDDFARQASALIGAPVAFEGGLDAKLLPSPYLRFRNLTAGTGDRKLTASEVEITLSIAPLLRGEFKAERIRIIRPQLALAVAADGTVATPFAAGRSGGADRVSFDRAEIVQGSIIVAAPQGRLVLDGVDGVAGAGSLAGPFRFEGAASWAGQRAAVRLNTGRADAGGAMRLRLAAAPAGRSETYDLDGSLQLKARPVFEGQAVFARPAPRAEQNAADAEAPWRAAARLKADPVSIVIDNLDLSYGRDDRALRSTGRGTITLTGEPRFDIALESRQIDLDRMLGERRPQTPAEAASALVGRFPGLVAPQARGRLSLDIRGLVLAGDVTQDLKATLVSDRAGWRVETLAATLPAGTKISAKGAVAFAEAGPGFAGRFDLASTDLPGFRTWLLGRDDAARPLVRSLAVKGELTARRDAISIDDATLTADGASAKGRLAWRAPERPGSASKLEAALTADRLDLDAFGLDRLSAGARQGGSGVDVALSLDAKTLVLGGVRMSGVALAGSIGESGLDLTRLAIADAEGAAIEGEGRFGLSNAAESRLKLRIDARRLEPLLQLARTAGAPESALAALRMREAALAPVKLSVDVGSGPEGPRVELKGEGAGGPIEGRIAAKAFSLDAETEIDVKLASPDGGRLASIVGFRLPPQTKPKGGELQLRLRGAPARGMTGDARLAAFGLDLAGRGAVALAPEAGLSASGDVTLKADDLMTFGMGLGRLGPGAQSAVPVALAAKVALNADQAEITNLHGSAAGRAVNGRLVVPYDARQPISGELAFDEASIGALAALAMPTPPGAGSADRRSVWSDARFGEASGLGLNGRVDVTAKRAPLFAAHVATDARFTLVLRPDAVTIDGFSAALAGGRLTGSAGLRRSGSDANVTFAGALDGARVDQALGLAAAASPIVGAIDLTFDGQGAGSSVAAIVSKLTGTGLAIIKDGAVRRLDVAAIDAVEPQVEAGLALEAPKVAAAIERGLGSANLRVQRAVVPFTVSGGVARSGPLTIEAYGAQLTGGTTVDLNRMTLDADLTLAPSRPDAPQIGVSFEGPIAGPRRRIEATAFTNWLSVRAVERETKRIEAMEADMRERARIARERAEEERRKEEARRKIEEEERRKAEEARLKAEAERKKRDAEARALIDSLPRPQNSGAPGLPAAIDISPAHPGDAAAGSPQGVPMRGGLAPMRPNAERDALRPAAPLLPPALPDPFGR